MAARELDALLRQLLRSDDATLDDALIARIVELEGRVGAERHALGQPRAIDYASALHARPALTPNTRFLRRTLADTAASNAHHDRRLDAHAHALRDSLRREARARTERYGERRRGRESDARSARGKRSRAHDSSSSPPHKRARRRDEHNEHDEHGKGARRVKGRAPSGVRLDKGESDHHARR